MAAVGRGNSGPAGNEGMDKQPFQKHAIKMRIPKDDGPKRNCSVGVGSDQGTTSSTGDGINKLGLRRCILLRLEMSIQLPFLRNYVSQEGPPVAQWFNAFAYGWFD